LIHALGGFPRGPSFFNFLKKGVVIMGVKRHLRGASSKEQRQYEHIKRSAQRSGRYGKRAKEVAARTVMKQHRKKKSSRSQS